MNEFRGYRDIFSEPDLREPYVYFPLHVEPEAATLVYAPFHTNQIDLVRSIAMSVPIDFKVYVKEHPGMVNLRKRSYYEKLLKIPNVRLIRTDFSSQELTKHARLITSITGTVGWEAVLLKKPVITFGRAFFNAFSSVHRCEKIETLPAMIQECLKQPDIDDAEIIDFLSAVFDEAYPFDFLKMWSIDTYDEMVASEELKGFAKCVYDKIVMLSTSSGGIS